MSVRYMGITKACRSRAGSAALVLCKGGRQTNGRMLSYKFLFSSLAAAFQRRQRGTHRKRRETLLLTVIASRTLFRASDFGYVVVEEDMRGMTSVM